MTDRGNSGGAFLFLVALVAIGLAIAASVGAETAEAKACGSIRVSGSCYIVGVAGVSCRYMRRWSRVMVRDGPKPRGWDKCTIRRSGSGGCHRGPARNRDFFNYYPPH